MVAWLLSHDNTEFAKLALRSELPSVKSSHLVEAFAASLGFRTYAALLARQKEANPLRPPFCHADSNLLSERLSELGYSVTVWDVMAAVALRSGIPNPCWREFPNRNLEANNSWFRQCQRFGLPNVCIKVRKKYVRVCWDCISISPQEDKHVRGQSRELMHAMFKDFQTTCKEFQTTAGSAGGKPYFFGSAFVGSVDNLLPPSARKLADHLFERLYLPLLDPTKSRREDWP
jgi:hypothetical protein